MRRSTVIVGASIGGVRTAQALRSAGYEGRVTLVGDEETPPYDRPPLSKGFLAGTATDQSMTLLTEADARDLDVRLMLGRAARRLDIAGGFVELDDGERLRYDDVVIATGSRARPSPWGKPAGVHYLRTRGDAAGLRADLRGGGPLVVIGAGFIGAEVAATARRLGVEVTLVDPAPVPMSRGLDTSTAARLGGMHREHGVSTRFGTQVEGIERGGGGLVVCLADGSVLNAAAIVVGIGAVPNTEWLGSSGLRIGAGVACDAHCRAYGAPQVRAIGDVAEWHHTGRGTLVRSEHWTNAVEQAGYVAADIARPGEQGPFQAIEYVWSDQYDAKIQIIGQTSSAARRVTVERPGSARSFAVLYATSAGELEGAVSVSWPQAALAARRAVVAGTHLDEVHASLEAIATITPPRPAAPVGN
ncbi:MAG TPA: FAD/NAD(P)-binding oxidoreductase [Trebonia sp.]|nr:FAD/NAD(P)-binding oxidoreductase [Trebonia sp.]